MILINLNYEGKLMDEDLTTEKNKTVTFRIDKQVLDKIKSYAAFERITLNALVNQLLAQAADWDIVAAKSGWVPIPKTFLIAWFDKLDEKTILSVAEQMGRNVSKDMLFSMRGKYDVWGVVICSQRQSEGCWL